MFFHINIHRIDFFNQQDVAEHCWTERSRYEIGGDAGIAFKRTDVGRAIRYHSFRRKCYD